MVIQTDVKNAAVLIATLCLGCATSTEELFRVADECGTEPECQPLWDAWNDRLEAIEKRKERKESMECPTGMTPAVNGDRYACMSREDLGRWLGRGRF